MKLYQVQDCRIWSRYFWQDFAEVEAASPAEAATRWAGRPVERITGDERFLADVVVRTKESRPIRYYWYKVVADNEAPASAGAE